MKVQSMITPDEIISELDQKKLNNRYTSRIKALNLKGLNTEIIENGVKEAVDVITKKNGKSFVVYGEPQSGKTEFMIALTCKLLDQGFKTIFIVVNDNTELEVQNFDRFMNASQLNPAPLRDSQLHDCLPAQLKQDIKRVIFCRKNSKRLDKLIINSRNFKDRIIIDDEADFATPDTNINKANKEATKINNLLEKLLQADKGGIYIGVTATPGRLDLNNTFLNRSDHWVFLDSHESYKGRAFFFQDDLNNNQRYILNTLPPVYDDPRFLRKAAIRFILRTSYLNYKQADLTAYSMLIHTAGRIRDHEDDKKVIDNLLYKLSNKDEKRINEMIELAKEIFPDFPDEDIKDIISFALNYIGKNQVLIINSGNDSGNVMRACQPQALFTFAIGGNIVSRGLTFSNLLSFFFSRGVKGKMQQNTYIQRARMFGSRPYAKYFELCVPAEIFEQWADVFQDHELSLRFAKCGDLAHVQGEGNRAADSRSIDKSNVQVELRERPIGEIFSLTKSLEDFLVNEFNSELKLSSTDIIRQLKSKQVIKDIHFPNTVLSYIDELSISGRKDQIILLSDGGSSIYSGKNISQWNDDLLFRERGGLIQAFINKRKDFLGKKHYIFPVKSIDGTRCRFLYRAELGHTILKNFKNKKKLY
ncbi:DNA helicase [Prochlorococcus marinus subsp. marinus str. CCMP1375]|uniref:DNA helicase n=2 Tax=Prochlorococcaceae TaxID=2881426 RepID=Q7VB26_PROMA|nr:DNA helicase [Prochlorococcus marinus subsp. marinus str. CCMP1375]